MLHYVTWMINTCKIEDTIDEYLSRSQINDLFLSNIYDQKLNYPH